MLPANLLADTIGTTSVLRTLVTARGKTKSVGSFREPGLTFTILLAPVDFAFTVGATVTRLALGVCVLDTVSSEIFGEGGIAFAGCFPIDDFAHSVRAGSCFALIIRCLSTLAVDLNFESFFTFADGLSIIFHTGSVRASTRRLAFR